MTRMRSHRLHGSRRLSTVLVAAVPISPASPSPLVQARRKAAERGRRARVGIQEALAEALRRFADLRLCS